MLHPNLWIDVTLFLLCFDFFYCANRLTSKTNEESGWFFCLLTYMHVFVFVARTISQSMNERCAAKHVDLGGDRRRYSEVAHDCSRGSWTCFETRGLPDWTPAGGYAAPAQGVVPLHVRWMLLFEDPINATIALLKTTPRSW